MGRRSHGRSLEVWSNGLHVATWVIPARGPMELRYNPTWIEAPEGRPLSLSLPFGLDGQPVRGERVGFFFDNPLPDGEGLRRRIQQRFGTASTDPIDLLAEVGRDCVGAVQLLPEGIAPEGVFQIEADPLDEEGVERLLLGASHDPLRDDDDHDDFRISLAGAQEKTAFLHHDGRWCRPGGATPTTHIFKLALGEVGPRRFDLRTSLENEWLCNRLLRELGVSVAPCKLATFGKTTALVVERFDRRLHSSGNYWLRLPQEDFCQATGTPGSRKYDADGGPGLETISAILGMSEKRDEDLGTLFRAVLCFWLLAAIDGHAKNFSLFLLPGGRFRLTPLYDVISAWPITGSAAGQIHQSKLKLAMALRGKGRHHRIAEIRRDHFNETARKCGLGSDMEPILEDVLGRIPGAIEKVSKELPTAFPGEVFEAITGGLRAAAEEMAREGSGMSA